MTPYHHSLSSARRWGGVPEDYQAVHNWMDESKAHYPDIRHRALRHHAEGILLCESLLGPTILNSDGRAVPIRTIAERHVKEDLGWIPTVKDWLQHIQAKPWMLRVAVKSGEIDDEAAALARPIVRVPPDEVEAFPDCGIRQGEDLRDGRDVQLM